MTLLLSVLTENFGSKYKSRMKHSGVKRALARMKHTGEALVHAGEHVAHSAEIAEANLSQKLISAARGFTEHARYFMNGRHGKPPPTIAGLAA